MDIICNCSVDVDETYDVSRTVVRVARKEHKCCECEQPIKPGQKYEYVSGCYEGKWDVWRTCIPCKSIRGRYCPDGFFFGFLRDNLYECLGMDYITGKLADWAESELKNEERK